MNRRGRKSYRLAVQAIVKSMAGQVEPEVARQALLAALVDLWGRIRKMRTCRRRHALSPAPTPDALLVA